MLRFATFACVTTACTFRADLVDDLKFRWETNCADMELIIHRSCVCLETWRALSPHGEASLLFTRPIVRVFVPHANRSRAACQAGRPSVRSLAYLSTCF